MSHDDFDFEPQRGLPAPLPQGERLLWQGSPHWKSLAIRAYHARKVALYFLFLIAWRIANGMADAHTLTAIASSCIVLLLMGVGAVAILSTLAYLSSRCAVFSITNRRILLRHGVAVPMTLNIPFKIIQSADLRLLPHQRGDLAVRLFDDQRVGYLITWPYLRPGRFAHPQPSLRCLEQAQQVAAILGGALEAYAASESAQGVAPASSATRAPRRPAIVQPDTVGAN